MEVLSRQFAHIRKTLIPRVEFKDARLEDVVVFLNEIQECRQCSPETHVQFVLDAESYDFPKVVFSARYCSVYELADTVCAACGLEMIFDGRTCFLRPKNNVQMDANKEAYAAH